jgi:hypothetical protein
MNVIELRQAWQDVSPLDIVVGLQQLLQRLAQVRVFRWQALEPRAALRGLEIEHLIEQRTDPKPTRAAEYHGGPSAQRPFS